MGRNILKSVPSFWISNKDLKWKQKHISAPAKCNFTLNIPTPNFPYLIDGNFKIIFLLRTLWK